MVFMQWLQQQSLIDWSREKKNRGYSYRKDYVTDEIVASESGTLYQFRHNKINYGIIAHATDGKNSIKAWVKERKVE